MGLSRSFVCDGCTSSLRVRADLAGKKVRCPRCRQVVRVPQTRPSAPPAPPVRRFPLLSVIVIAVVVAGCTIWANLSFVIKDKTNLKYIPPFEPGVNVNGNRHLGGEYFQMAKSLAAGQGFSHPFDRPTGPTAWQAPVLPLILAGLLWIFEGSRDGVMTVVLVLQALIQIGTGVLVVTLAQQTTRRIGAAVAAGVFVVVLLSQFRNLFQVTHDPWIVLLALDLVLAGSVWCRPLDGKARAAGWGLLGGLCALTTPIAGVAWVGLSLLAGVRQRAWLRLGVALLAAGLTLTPWTVRNYLVFGRFIPTKSNLAFELYQSQVLQPEGLLGSFRGHPYGTNNREGQEYKQLGEAAYLERKWQQFWESVRADPLEFTDRVASRFLGATLWYVPFNRHEALKRPWSVWTSRVLHPLPFLGLVVLLFTAVRRPLHGAQWTVIGLYAFYLLPYVAASYYDRYAVALLGVKVLLVVWGVDRLLALLCKEKTSAASSQSVHPSIGTTRPSLAGPSR